MRIKDLLLVGLVIGTSMYADGINMNNHAIGNTNSGIKQGSGHMFEQHKSMLMQMHQQRMQIIQNGYNCLSSATNREALHSCEMGEKQSMEALKAQFQQQRESMKQERRDMGQMPGNQRESIKLEQPQQ